MSAAEALLLARENGIRIAVAGGDLVLNGEREPHPAVLETLRRHKAEIVAFLAAHADNWTGEDWLAFFNERAGIAEADGAQPREQAEATAFECCVVEWLDRHPSQSDPSRCAACGKSERDRHVIVPFGSGNHGHTWLHPECWQGWYEARKLEAVAALAAIGIRKPAKFPNDFGKNGGA